MVFMFCLQRWYSQIYYKNYFSGKLKLLRDQGGEGGPLFALLIRLGQPSSASANGHCASERCKTMQVVHVIEPPGTSLRIFTKIQQVLGPARVAR